MEYRMRNAPCSVLLCCDGQATCESPDPKWGVRTIKVIEPQSTVSKAEPTRSETCASSEPVRSSLTESTHRSLCTTSVVTRASTKAAESVCLQGFRAQNLELLTDYKI